MGKSFFERLFSPFFLLAIHLHPVEDGEFSLFYMLNGHKNWSTGDAVHFALTSGHWCVCQRTLGAMNGQT